MTFELLTAIKLCRTGCTSQVRGSGAHRLISADPVNRDLGLSSMIIITLCGLGTRRFRQNQTELIIVKSIQMHVFWGAPTHGLAHLCLIYVLKWQ